VQSKYNVIDLFCGAGGLSKGFKDANYNILAGIDFDDAALETYNYNFKNSKALKIDLFNHEEAIQNIKDEISEPIDVIIAGPPCQGFSLTGSRDINDTRNKLYLSVVQAVKEFKPKAFLIENVPGMATLYKGKIKHQIVNTFTDLGYNVSYSEKPLLAADYGVPQMRKRMFFVGLRNDEYSSVFDFPKPIHNKENYISTEQAISDLPSLVNDLGENITDYISTPSSEYQQKMRTNADKLYNHVGTNHTEEVKFVISHVPEGGNHKDLPEGIGISRKFNEAWTRYHSQKPSKTIDTGHRNHFHYKWNRVPTVRENARLQSFPDNFIFLGTKTQQYRQVGNAVPPLLTQHIAIALEKYLDQSLNKTIEKNQSLEKSLEV